MFKIISNLFLIFSSLVYVNAQPTETNSFKFNQESEQFLKNIKAGEDTSSFRNILANTSIETLEKNLKTDADKLAFWVNIYNGYIQIILSETPSLYDDRGSFFKKKQIPVAGDTISFEKIEHGIIRKSQWPLGLGFIRKWFPNKLERILRVDEKDYRIHFALNCGAKDCPPVAIYDPKKLNEQFNEGSKNYLKNTSTYNKENNKATITPLFSWFRGDFGNKKEVKNILEKHQVISSSRPLKIEYKTYDWTLDLDNWTDL